MHGLGTHECPPPTHKTEIAEGKLEAKLHDFTRQVPTFAAFHKLLYKAPSLLLMIMTVQSPTYS